MPSADKVAAEIKLDERNHVEKPLLDQLAGLGWQIIDLDSKQTPVNNSVIASLMWSCCQCCGSS